MLTRGGGVVTGLCNLLGVAEWGEHAWLSRTEPGREAGREESIQAARPAGKGRCLLPVREP